MSVAAFSEQLWPLTHALEDLYGEWLPRLRAAFGSWRRPSHRDPAGEPDGYGGLSRRGLWERLVVSEWAIAEAVPDEFIRRAAMKEQLFLELSRVVPAAAPVTRVWLDCGPTQLGAPRLAHLAILVVLRRRAEEAGGELLWATLHEPELFHDTLDPSVLLAARSTAPLPERVEGEGECLVIGSAVSGARQIEVREAPGLLRVRFDNRVIELQLPDMAAVASMLLRPKQPIRPTRSVPGGLGPVEAIRFVPGGGALLVRSEERVVAFAVPDRERERTQLRDGDWAVEGLVAVGWKKQRLATLRRIDNEAVFNLRGTLHRLPWPAGFRIAAAGLPWMHILPRATIGPQPGKRRVAVMVRDAGDVLYVFDFTTGEATPIGKATTDVYASDSVVTYFSHRNRVRLFPGGSDKDAVPALADHGRREEVSEAVQRSISCQDSRLVLAQHDGEAWQVGHLTGFGPSELRLERLPTDLDVVGAVRQPFLGLVVREANQVSVLTQAGLAPIFQVSEGLDEVAVGGRRTPLLALSTRRGEVVMVTLGGDVWLRFWPADAI